MEKIQYLALTLPNGRQVTGGGGIPEGGLDKVRTVVSRSLTIFLILGVVLCLFFIIWGGIQWTTSGGDKSKVDSARKRITFAIVGLVVMLFSFAILGLLGYFFKVNLLNF
jgi:hypothetical protein